MNNLCSRLSIGLLLATWAAIATAQQAPTSTLSHTAASPPVQTVHSCELGDFVVESGSTIPNFKMTFATYGTLASDKSNAILSLHGLRANRNSQSFMVGTNKAFDPTRYFVIQPDTLGVASLDPIATTSPTRSGMNMKFPRFTIRDMVKAEHAMLTKCLGIKHLVAVTGVSMGGIETFQWAVSYPDFMDAIIPVVPQAKASRQVNFVLESARQDIMADPKWNDGNYSQEDPPRTGVGLGLLVQNAFISSSQRFEQQYKNKEEVQAAVAADRTESGKNIQARDWVYRTWAIDSHNIGNTPGFNGNLTEAARSIKARVLLFPNCHDQLLSPVEGGVFEAAENIAQVKIVNLNDISGHTGFITPTALALITAEIRDLLQRLDEGRPGISGPKFPAHWAPGNYCGR